MKKILSATLATVVLMGVFTGCLSDSGEESSDSERSFGGDITVISREDGSGTRGAFVELTGVEGKDANGKKIDNTTVEAIIASKTDAVLTNVSGDEKAIGYISMGSINDMVKPLKVNGALPTTENVKNGSYKIARPFNIATKPDANRLTKDFIKFMLSKQGQEIVADSYITVNDTAEEYIAANLSGKIVINGSSSVSPLMERLIESYTALNPDVKIELNTTDSTGGINDAISGVCDIGMASRELKDSEIEKLAGTTIAMDGIAVIVNNENPTDDMRLEQIKAVYTGEVTAWEELL